MTFRNTPYAGLFLSLLFAGSLQVAAPAFAQSPSGPDDGMLHILRPSVQAEQDKAELCLEFDRAIDDDFAKVTSAIKLTTNGKAVSLSPQNLGIGGNTACISNLEHRRSYRLSVGDLRGSENEKLNEAYHLSFTVPDRKPSLAFLSDLYGGGLLRWQENDPVLRGVNVDRAKIELYRVTDPALMAEGWRQRLQTTLAPSESAYFARNKGQLLWQGEIILENAPNKAVEQKVPARSALGNLQPGLYLIVASMTSPKTTDAKNKLAPLAASWLLRSDLRLHAVRGSNGFYGLAEKADATAPLSGVHLTILDGGQQMLVEGKTDATGAANLTLSDDKVSAAQTLMASTDAGDVDFADLTRTADNNFLLGGLDASVTLAKNFYAPGASVDAIFAARDLHGKLTPIPGSRLVVLRPGRSFYAQYPLPKDDSGVAHILFPAPPENGAWILAWQKPNGETIKETTLRVTSNPDAPRLTFENDKPTIGEDGNLDLSVKSIATNGKPAAFIPGRASITWAASNRSLPGWDGYSFGSAGEDPKTQPITSDFVTDANGNAQVRFHLDAPQSAEGALYTVLADLHADPATGSAEPASLRITMKPRDMAIGIKPFADGAHFAENAIARFDVMAIGADGKRIAADNLHYQIFEEGRSFDWYQAEGKWNYTPQQQRRSAGGGALSLKQDGSNTLDWPVTAGNYSLEITGANHKVLARMPFGAGWDPSKAGPTFGNLALTPPASPLHVGENAKARFHLDAPAIITAIITDDHIRKILHEARKEGDNEFTFTPDASWGDRVTLRIEARGVNADGSLNRSAGQSTLTIAHTEAATVTEILPPLDVDAPSLPVLQSGDMLHFDATIRNNTNVAGSYRYAFTSDAGLKFGGAVKGEVKIVANQSASVSLTITAPLTGSHEIKLDVTGPHNAHVTHAWPLSVLGHVAALTNADTQTIEAQQALTLPAAKTASYVFIGPRPLYGTPQILLKAIRSPVFTTRDIAMKLDIIRLWHATLATSDILPESWLSAAQNNLALRLLARQNENGGWSALANLPNMDADIGSTSAAIEALGLVDLPAARASIDRASEYLKQRLDNNWFDENERPQRAAAYAALAAIGKLDAASLQHFSDDCAKLDAGKTLPPAAAAQLAYAFAKNSEPEKSAFWLNIAGDAKNDAGKNSDLLIALASNGFFDAATLLPALKKLSTSTEPSDNAAFLTAMAYVQNRAGNWKLTAAHGEETLHGVFALPRADKSAALTLKNPNEKPIYVIEAAEAAAPAASVTRSIYRMNGEKIAAPSVRSGETYLVVLEGAPASGANADIILQDNPGPALRPVSCALNDSMRGNENLAWLHDMPLSQFASCDVSGGKIDILMAPRGDGAKGLRAAYLAEAEWGGTFTGQASRTASVPHANLPAAKDSTKE